MSSGRCIFQGEFGEIRIPDLLTFLDMLGRTGTLEVRRGDERKRIWLDRGEIVFADSSVPADQVSAYLARNGLVRMEVVASARERAREESAIIKLLIGEHALDPAVLIKGMKSLVLDIVYAIFEWEEGTFAFFATPEAHAERVMLKASVSNIIMEGSRRLDEWRRIRESFPSDDVYPVPSSTDGVASVKLPPAEQEILWYVDGRSTVAGIIHRSGHDQFTTLGALLTLLNAGLISVASAPLAQPPPPPSDALTAPEREEATAVVAAFNAIFSGIHERIRAVKGAEGEHRFAATLDKESFQRGGVLAGRRFGDDGRLDPEALLGAAAQLPAEERLAKLKGSLDRLLAQLVLQLDKSFSPEDKKAVSDLIAREKSRLGKR